MNWILTPLFFAFLIVPSFAQTTLTFTLGPADEDAAIDDFNPGNNDANALEYHMAGWTINGDPVSWRNLLKFNLTSISQYAVVQSANLSLHFALNNTYGAQHSTLTHSNECVLQRITSIWAENLITWNNQPTITSQNQVLIPVSVTATQDYPNIDVTAMVQQMVSDPPVNHGFMLSMVDESPYARMIFASGDNPDPGLRPVLTVTYFEPCVTLTLDAIGEDAPVDDYNPTGFNANEIEYLSGAWTINGQAVTWRNFFRFDVTSIPATAVIQDARLSLYYAAINNFSNAYHSSLTHSNESVIQRVTSPWQESFVTWNNQPVSTTQNELIVQQTVSDTQDFPDLDVTAIVQDMFADPANSYGFVLKATNETPYARMLIASGDNPDVTKHPTLRICWYDPASVHGPVEHKEAKVFPNPGNGSFQLRLVGRFNYLSVTNQLGQAVFYRTISNNETLLDLELNHLSEGVYILRLSGDSSAVHKKLLIRQ